MGRPPKVGGLRTTRIGEADGSEPSVLPQPKQGMYQFRSSAPSLRFSVRRRRIERGPDGEKEEVAPRTKDGFDVPMDIVMFEDNYFETPSPELATAIIEKATSLRLYGVGLTLWSLADEKAAQDAALERELRARVESRPDIAARVLRPGEAEDFRLPKSGPPAA